jgi:hypothetical protein
LQETNGFSVYEMLAKVKTEQGEKSDESRKDLAEARLEKMCDELKNHLSTLHEINASKKPMAKDLKKQPNPSTSGVKKPTETIAKSHKSAVYTNLHPRSVHVGDAYTHVRHANTTIVIVDINKQPIREHGGTVGNFLYFAWIAEGQLENGGNQWSAGETVSISPSALWKKGEWKLVTKWSK